MKHKPYPKYKDSGIEWLGMIPDRWEAIRIRWTLIDGKDGIRIGPFGSMVLSNIIKDEGYKIYGQECIIANDFERGHRYIDDEKYTELKDYAVRPHDVLLTMMGTSGRCAVFPDGLEPGIMDPHLLRMRLNINRLAPKFLALLIDQAKYVQHHIVIAGRGTIMHGLNTSIVKDILIALPKLEEQNDILKYLDRETGRIDELMAKKKRQIELLQEKRQALISHAVTKGLDPKAKLKDSGIEWLGMVPEGWEVKRVKFEATTISKGTTPSTEGLGLTDVGIRFLKAENITEQGVNAYPEFFIDDDTHRTLSRSHLKARDVLVVIAGATTGKTAVLGQAFVPANTNQAVSFIRLRNPDYSAFLATWLRTSVIQDQIWQSAVQSAQPNLSMENLGNLPCLVPPREELSNITAYLDCETVRIDELMGKIRASIEKLREYRTALISAAVTGKIDLRGEV